MTAARPALLIVDMGSRRAWLLLVCALLGGRAQATPPLVVHLELRGVVNPIKVRHLKHGLERAKR